MSFIVFIVVLLTIFGPKLIGVIDLSIVGGVVAVSLLRGAKSIELSHEHIVVTGLVLIVFIQSTLVVIFSGVDDMQPFLRHIRALVSTALLSVFHT